MLTAPQSKQIGNLFKILGHPFRLRLLAAVAVNEACVCHLEQVLGKRQAYISQHLMALREAEIIEARREGKYIFYILKDQEFLNLIQSALRIKNLHNEQIPPQIQIIQPECECPSCVSLNT